MNFANGGHNDSAEAALNLAEVGVEVDARGNIKVDELSAHVRAPYFCGRRCDGSVS